MDALTQSFFELLDAANGDLDLLFNYLVDFFGSSSAAEQVVITEDLVLG
jgi:hypothetical protein